VRSIPEYADTIHQYPVGTRARKRSSRIDMSNLWQKCKPLVLRLLRSVELAALTILAHPWTALLLVASVVFILYGTPPLCSPPNDDFPDDGMPSPDLGPLHFVRPGDDKPVIDSLPAKPEPHVIIHGQGQVAVADSILPVSLELIEYSATERWVRLRIGQEYVTFTDLDWWSSPEPINRWRAVGEVSLLDGVDFGIGCSYNIGSYRDIHAGPALVVDTNMRWGALEARFWRPITRHASVDLGLGYQLNMDGEGGPHLAIGVGVDL